MLINPRQIRIEKGLRLLTKDTPAKDEQLYSGFDAAKKAITSILKAVDADKIKIASANDLYKLSVALSALIKCQVDYERWSAERLGFIDEAEKDLIKLVRNRLAQNPEVREKLGDIIGAAAEEQRAGKQIESATD